MTDIENLGREMAYSEADNSELRVQNRSLATQLQNKKQVEEGLINRICQLEGQQSDDDAMLCGINRYWKAFDENCRILSKQFEPNCDISMFDTLDDNANSFLVQLSTWDVEELSEKLESRVEQSKQYVQKMIIALNKLLSFTEKLETFIRMGVKPKSEEIVDLKLFIKIRRRILSLQKKYYTLNLRIRNKQDILHIKETRNDELRNRANNLKYQNTKLKVVTDKLEHNLAELLDKIKQSEISDELLENKKEFSTETEILNVSSPASISKFEELEREIALQKRISETYLNELQTLNLQEQESVEQYERLKIEIRQLPEQFIIQSSKYKFLQSNISILYNDACQLRESWDEIQTQMHALKSSFNNAQRLAERQCLLQQKNIRQEMIKIDDTNGQLRHECQKLKMELEQSIAENNLFGSLNSEMKKLMSSMLDYCKQHESDIRRYKRKHEEIEEDLRFSRAMPSVNTNKKDRLMHVMRFRDTARRRFKERDTHKDKMQSEITKDLRLRESNRDFLNGHDLMDTDSKDIKDKQCIKDLKIQYDSQNALKDSKDSLHHEIRNGKDGLSRENWHDDLMTPKELSHCKDLAMGCTKIIYSKEVLKSKEMLKERYLRDCTKMRMGELPKEAVLSPSIEKDFENMVKDVDKNKVKSVNKIDINQVTIKSTKDNETIKISNIVNLDSDDSGHDEPKIKKSDLDNKSLTVKESSTEQNVFIVSGSDSINLDSAKTENKETGETKRTAPPSKKDLFINNLKYQIKKIMDEKKDLNLLLGMYKNVSKNDEEKVQLLVSEQKLKTELEEVKKQMRRIEDSRYDDRKDLVDVAMSQKIKYLAAKRRRLQKKIEEAKDSLLCGEMEITGQVWDELQAQNTRLHQLLREKDEENLKLMTERVKSNQLYNLSKEENESMTQQINTNKEKIERMSEVIHKMEERETAFRTRLEVLETELLIRKKECELKKQIAVQNSQVTANLKRQIEKYHTLIKELQQIKSERNTSLENQVVKNNILLVELNQLRKKMERVKKYESVDTIEAILTEELKEYKMMLTCPSCKVNTKDAVLIKCFHVYCMNCIKTRYETRQRKCPECCAPFGANDYHRLFLFN